MRGAASFWFLSVSLIEDALCNVIETTEKTEAVRLQCHTVSGKTTTTTTRSTTPYDYSHRKSYVPSGVPFVIEGDDLSWTMVYNGTMVEDYPVHRQFDPNSGGFLEGVLSFSQEDNLWSLNESWGGPRRGYLQNCVPYTEEDLEKCTVRVGNEPATIRPFASSVIGTSCNPVAATVGGSGKQTLVGNFDSLIDCSEEAHRKFPDVTAVQRDPRVGGKLNVPCYGYEGPVTIQASNDAKGFWSCEIWPTAVPGEIRGDVIDSLHADSFRACAEGAAAKGLGSVSYAKSDGTCWAFNDFKGLRTRSTDFVSVFFPHLAKKE